MIIRGTDPVRHDFSLLTADDLFLFNEGTHSRLYEKMGAQMAERNGVPGTWFAVWAPDAAGVFVMGDFNGWNKTSHALRPRGQSGVWEGWIPGLGKGASYKYFVRSRYRGYRVDKADPFSFFNEVPPRTASIVWDHRYSWEDGEWMKDRGQHNAASGPMSIYEIHLGSWRRVPEENHRSLTYREMAEILPPYLADAGFTHAEFLPVMEHPFYGSWGYQGTGYFAPTSRYGTPQDFMFLIDSLHRKGIGVILDWVPSHFPNDMHGLGFFDGTHLYEHQDPRRGVHPDWNSFIFNYGRKEVRCFLLSNALFWLDRFHVDGLRVDAVASMLYLDYSRREGEWIANVHGGRENLEAISFLRRFNEEVYRSFPETQTIAEESTAWPMVSKPTYVGGLGFGMKWDMGWMHDTLKYIAEDPVHRKYHHDKLTFGLLYAWDENFILPISHDEVVHGKGSLIGKMPGDIWQKLANLRAYLGFMWTHPGKKLLFMGCEFGQLREWTHDHSLDWHLLDEASHRGVQTLVRDLNGLYRSLPALHALDCEPGGFAWVDGGNANDSVLVYLRKGRGNNDVALVVCNFTPVVRQGYRIGVPRPGRWTLRLNTDAPQYGGSGVSPEAVTPADAEPWHGLPFSVVLTLPPLSVLILTPEDERA